MRRQAQAGHRLWSEDSGFKFKLPETLNPYYPMFMGKGFSFSSGFGFGFAASGAGDPSEQAAPIRLEVAYSMLPGTLLWGPSGVWGPNCNP